MSTLSTFEKAATIIVCAIGALLVLLWLVFEFSPFFDQFDPAFREAKATCDSIKVGMTYDAVKQKVGTLFVPGAATYVDPKGDGQVWLVNNVKSSRVACNIQIEREKVVSVNMMNEGSW